MFDISKFFDIIVIERFNKGFNKMAKCLMSASSKEELEKLINEYYFSENYFINSDLKIENKENKKIITSLSVVNKKGRWQAVRNEKI